MNPFMPGSSTGNIEIVRVTPELAREWLETFNTHNRRVKAKHASRLARDMANDRWIFNGDPIRFSKTRLLDGQHRLAAIVESGTTQAMVILWDLDDSAQDTMDIGSRRSMADQLTLSGEKDCAMLGAVLRIAIPYANGHTSTNVQPTQAEMRAFLDEHPHARRAAEVARKAQHELPTRPSVIGAAYLLCSFKDKSAAEQFFVTQLIEQLGLNSNDPAKALSRNLATARRQGRKHHPDELMRYTLRAWNMFREGRHVSTIQAPRGGWTAKNFPHPK